MFLKKTPFHHQGPDLLANSVANPGNTSQIAGPSKKTPPTDPGSGLRQKPSHFQLLNVLMGILLVILLAEWCWIVTRRPTPLLIQRGEEFRRSFRVEINSATWVEWMQLEGIGPALANRIVADRHLNGPFVSIEDLERVPGIGTGTLDRLRPSLIVRHEQKTAQRNNQ